MKKILHVVLMTMAICLLPLEADGQLSSNPDKFLGNITTRYSVDYGSTPFYKLWNQITPENETKWDAIEGSSRGSFSFGNADKSANYAKQHKFPFKYHTLIWGAQYPNWMNNLSTAEQYKAIVEYFDGVKKHYPNLEIIDVVNEAIQGHQPAPYKAALGGDGRTGYDWIVKAFQLAHERWPDAILVYNDYNTFQWNTDQFISLVQALRDAGAPIDAYGCQSHDLTDISLSNFKSSMTKIQNALKMPMYSTEFDIGTSDDSHQENQYKQLFPYLWEAEYCAGVTLWGYIYGATWTTDGNSGLIRDGKDRPAMTWLRDYMKTDAAKNAKSPFPGFKKEASLYVKPASNKVAKGDKLPVLVDARLATKTIEKVELYVGTNLVATMTEAPYIAEVTTTTTTGQKTLKAVVTATDGSTYERLARYTVQSGSTARRPYNGVTPQLPGTVNAMEYDEGIAGVAYNNAARTGATKTGGWMEYTVNVQEAGLYSMDVEVASQSGGLFHLVDNHYGDMIFLTDFVEVPNTGGASEYKTFHVRFNVPLEAGQRTLCLCVDQGGFNIKNMTFTRLEVDNTMKIAVKANPTTVNVDEPAAVTVTASSTKSTIANVRVFANDMLVATLTESPYTTEFTPTKKGTHVITAIATDAEGLESKIAKTNLKVNGKRVPYVSVTLPGTVQFENFDRGGEGLSFHDSDDLDEGGAKYRTDNEGVDIVTGNGGHAIGYTAADEWLEYTVNVTEAATFDYDAYVSSGSTGAGFTISEMVNGKATQLTAVSIPQTANNDWSVYQTVSGTLSKPLEAGQHILRVTITGAYGNLDKIVFKKAQGGDDPEPSNVDPNFHIYLCFGQSNMEGNAQWETVDNTVDSRFRMLATTNFDNPKRTLGKWYIAKCPIVSPAGKLGPTDYFGRSMVAAMPSDVKIGVVAVAMGGSPIEMFDKDKYQKKMADNPNEWWVTLAKNYYGGNPYGRLIDMAREAQKVGVIKGILLHQGCSNCGDPNWPNMVKKIYNDMLTDLGLEAKDVPLFAGETEQADQGGGCSSHNTVVAKLPSVIPTAHVVHTNGIPGNGTDPWHFSASGYRTLGKRYAIENLKVLGMPAQKDQSYSFSASLKKFYALKQIDDVKVTLRANARQKFSIWGTFNDGHREDLTNEVTLTSDDFEIQANGYIKVNSTGDGVVTVTYTDFTGVTHTKDLAFGSKVGITEAGVEDYANGNSNVYSLHGMKVGVKEQWNALPAGIYVVDGKLRRKE